MHFLLQRILLARIQLNPCVKSEHRQLRRKDTRHKLTYFCNVKRKR